MLDSNSPNLEPQAGTLNLKVLMQIGESHRLRAMVPRTTIQVTDPARIPNPQVPIQTEALRVIRTLPTRIGTLHLDQLTWRPTRQTLMQNEGTIL